MLSAVLLNELYDLSVQDFHMPHLGLCKLVKRLCNFGMILVVFDCASDILFASFKFVFYHLFMTKRTVFGTNCKATVTFLA